MGNLFDLEYLEEISQGDTSIILELVQLFSENTDKYFSNIKKAYSTKNWQEFNTETHSYSSQVAMLKPKTEILQKLEILNNFEGEDNKKEEILTIVEELEIEIRKIIISLTSEFAE